MAPIEWPIAAPSGEDGRSSAHVADGERLTTVRADLALDPALRLTEQERALITAMLSDLVDVVADEVAAAIPINDNGFGEDLFGRLRTSRLLDIPELVRVLLRRAEEERLCAGLRAALGRENGRFLHSFAADADPAVAAAAMAVVLGRSRRRDRYGGPRVQLDDFPAEAAVQLVNSVAAGIGLQHGEHSAASNGAQSVLAQHDEGKRLEALGFRLVHELNHAGRLDERFLHSSLSDGEVAIFVEGLCQLSGIDFESGWTLLRRSGGLAKLLKITGISRPCAAEIIAMIGELLPSGAGSEIRTFDSIGETEANAIRARLRLDPHYRAALGALES